MCSGRAARTASRSWSCPADPAVVSLHDQFRCGGSEAYEGWVLDLLGLDGGEPSMWVGDGRFDLRGAESPQEMETFLSEQQAAGETARMSAGYCWPWSDPWSDGSLVPDVQVGDRARPWNVMSDRSVGEAPGSAFWATDPHGFGQVGCVYTAQGFEYGWSGVIIGPRPRRTGRETGHPAGGVEGSGVPQPEGTHRYRG
ncbi:DNA/RNA helicase domain-containing protein [Micromonospora humi]|uniref:DNA/RNA helicase domain-containing protein n=1 Tax=Micromonospora humi TaxID=745366 RepID=UPI0024810605|nr:DNA/RNA helicase domain-containing protein [Micromonospora humi]